MLRRDRHLVGSLTALPPVEKTNPTGYSTLIVATSSRPRNLSTTRGYTRFAKASNTDRFSTVIADSSSCVSGIPNEPKRNRWDNRG